VNLEPNVCPRSFHVDDIDVPIEGRADVHALMLVATGTACCPVLLHLKHTAVSPMSPVSRHQIAADRWPQQWWSVGRAIRQAQRLVMRLLRELAAAAMLIWRWSAVTDKEPLRLFRISRQSAPAICQAGAVARHRHLCLPLSECVRCTTTPERSDRCQSGCEKL
jgi:hypothetical protein